MAPFAVCSNQLCDYFTDLELDCGNTTRCPRCRSKTLTACQSCRKEITEEGVDGKFTMCNFCDHDVRRAPPPTVDRAAEEQERRTEIAVKRLEELILLVMEKVAAEAGITQEDLAEAFEAGTEGNI